MSNTYKIINTKLNEEIATTSNLFKQYNDILYNELSNIGDPKSKHYVFDCKVEIQNNKLKNIKTFDLFDLLWNFLYYELIEFNMSIKLDEDFLMSYAPILTIDNQTILHEYMIESNMYNNQKLKEILTSLGIRFKKYGYKTSYSTPIGFNGKENYEIVKIILMGHEDFILCNVNIVKSFVKDTLLANDFKKLVKENRGKF